MRLACLLLWLSQLLPHAKFSACMQVRPSGTAAEALEARLVSRTLARRLFAVLLQTHSQLLHWALLLEPVLSQGPAVTLISSHALDAQIS